MRCYLLAVIARGMLCLSPSQAGEGTGIGRCGDGEDVGMTRWDEFSCFTTAISARDLGHCGSCSSRNRRTLVHLNNSVVLTQVHSPGEIFDLKVKAAEQGS